MLKLAISNVVISKKNSRFLKHNHVIVVLQDIVCKLEVVKKLGKKQERPQVCHFEFVPSWNGRTSLVENTVPFGTWKFRKCQPEILVGWKAPRVNTAPFENLQPSPLKLTNEKIRLFPERSAELDFQIYLEMYCLDPSTLLVIL